MEKKNIAMMGRSRLFFKALAAERVPGQILKSIRKSFGWLLLGFSILASNAHAQGVSYPLDGACSNFTEYQPGQVLPTPPGWSAPAAGQIQPTPPSIVPNKWRGVSFTYNRINGWGGISDNYLQRFDNADQACQSLAMTVNSGGGQRTYTCVNGTAGPLWKYSTSGTCNCANSNQFGVYDYICPDGSTRINTSTGFKCQVTDPSQTMKPSDGTCNVVYNNKNIPAADPLDPDCKASANACNASMVAIRELNSGITDCSTGQTCVGNPINPGAGVKFEQVSLYRGIYPSPLNVELQFLQLPGTAFTAPTYSWRNPFGSNVQIITDNGYTYGRVVLPPYSPNQFNYFHRSGAAWVGEPGSKVTLTEIKNASGILTGFQVVDANDTIYDYTLNPGSTTAAGLYGITMPDGRKVTIAYPAAGQTTMTDQFGHTVSFTTNAAGLIATMTAPDGNITNLTWDTVGTKLLSIKWPDNKVRTFLYENATWPNALTGIVDENGDRYATWTYDTAGNATGSWHGDTLNADKTALTYNADGSVVATEALGSRHTYQFSMINGIIKTNGLSQPCASCGTNYAALTYDTNGNIASRTDFNGNKTCYTYDLARNLETVRLEGLPAATACPTDLAAYVPATGSVERKTTTQWHASLRLPEMVAEPLRITGYTYDTKGNLQTRTVQPTADATGGAGQNAVANGTARTTRYTYNPYGQVLTADGPRTDVSDLTTYTYDNQGSLVTVTNALNHTTTLGDYDPNGRAGRITDPNGLATYLSYDARGRLTARDAGGETTRYTYDGVGQLTNVSLPNGASYTYTYDAAHRLTRIGDAQNNALVYTLDNAGNRTREQLIDAAGNIIQTHSRVFDALSRLQQDIGAVNQTTTYTYDANGNLKTVTDPLNRQSANTYDALNRLSQVTQADGGVIRYGYDGLDQLGAVTDPRNLVTRYSRDGLGNLNQQTSPDTGTTGHTYDAAGNILTRTDAKGQVASYTYDALNRLTAITYSGGQTQSVGYQYDQGTNGIGRLTRIVDATGTTDYGYDPRGRLTGEIRQPSPSVSYTTSYGYDPQGRMNSITYPSGRAVNYSFDSMGRISQISTTWDGTAKILASNIRYEPFGGVHSFTYGDGTATPVQTYVRQRDRDGRIAGYTLNGKPLSIGYDAASQISFIADPANLATTANYGYDDLSRLTGYTQSALGQNYSYDPDGNRISQTVGSTITNYAYAPDSNRLTGIQTGAAIQSLTHDPNGATTSDATRQYAYDNRGRLIRATTAQGIISYEVNALGLRTRKTVPYANTDTLYHYDPQGHLIAENEAGSTRFTREYIYLGDQPVAVMQ